MSLSNGELHIFTPRLSFCSAARMKGMALHFMRGVGVVELVTALRERQPSKPTTVKGTLRHYHHCHVTWQKKLPCEACCEASSWSSGTEHHITPLLCDFLPFISSCSQPSHTTDHKNGTHCLAWHSALRDHPMIPEGSIAASHQSLTGGVMCRGQAWHPLGCDSGTLTKPDQPPVHVGAYESICLSADGQTDICGGNETSENKCEYHETSY